MFRKIVSNLSFSPALIGQLSFYAKRLRKEEATRRLGLIFTALALIVQGFAVFQPPQPANAASSADFIPGGVSSVKDFLGYYDQNYHHIRSILDSLGITRSEIAKAKYTVIGENSRYNWSMTSLYSYAQGQRGWDYKKADGATGTVYYRPMRLTQEGGNRHPVFASYSPSIGWFAIKIDCGNLITAKTPHVPQPVAACQNLDINQITSTRFRFTGKSSATNGAEVKSYTYTVRDSQGKIILRKTNASNAKSDSYVYDQTQPGRYSVGLVVLTSVGERAGDDCHAPFTVASPKPTAVCTQLSIDIADQNMISLSGSAAASNGATINSYNFVTNDISGKSVNSQTISGSSTGVTASTFTLAPGTYTATLAVNTSIGKVTDANDCVKQFTIQKPNVCTYNPSLPANSPECQPCQGDTGLWINDQRCNVNIVYSKTTTNITQGNTDATTVTAQAGDKISYTISAMNNGDTPQNIAMSDPLSDVLEYSTLIDNGGGTQTTDSNGNSSLQWQNVTIASHTTQSRSFVVQVLNPIPATNTGASNADSYDCIMTNTLGNSTNVRVQCPEQKVIVEQTVSELPHTGPKENVIVTGIFLAIVVFFYARSRQLDTEVRLIRRNVNTGTI